MGDLAPEVTLYYKHICRRRTLEESKEPTSEDEAMMRIEDNIENLAKALADDEMELPVGSFPFDKSKLH